MNSPAPAAFGLSEIGQVALTVRNVAAATAYYRDVLGLKFLFQAPPGLAFFMAGSVRVMLSAPEKADAPVANSVLYFKVADIAAAHAALQARGANFVDEPHLIARMPDHELWMVFLRDPDQNLIGLMEERR